MANCYNKYHLYLFQISLDLGLLKHNWAKKLTGGSHYDSNNGK